MTKKRYRHNQCSSVSTLMIMCFLVLVTTVIGKATRHNRHRNGHDPLTRVLERHVFPFEELSKHAYDTSSRDVFQPSISRFPKLDRMLNKLKRQPKLLPKPQILENHVDFYDKDKDGKLLYELPAHDDDLVTSAAPPRLLLHQEEEEEGQNLPEMKLNTIDETVPNPTTIQIPILEMTTTESMINNSTTIVTTAMTSLYNESVGPKSQEANGSKCFSSDSLSSCSKVNVYSHLKKKEKSLAKIHLWQMKTEGICRWPKPKVIHVQDVFPTPSKIYVPNCAILHRCGHDTGCCDNENLVCREKSFTTIELYFVTKNIVDHVQKEEKLEFVNHTECECGQKISKNTPLMISEHLMDDSHRFVPSKPRPQCPSKFSLRSLPDGTFLCDCFDKQKDCLRLKRGRGFFSKEDQLCIENALCMMPLCEYGQYLRKNGRCVQKTEMFHYWPKYSSGLSYTRR